MIDVHSFVVARFDRARAALGTDVDAAWLAALRAVFGLTMCVSMLRFIAYGWIDDFWVRPRFHFKYWGFAFVEPLSPSLMHALFWGLAALALAMAVGFFARWAGALFLLGFAYVQLLDVTTYLNHYYLAALLTALLVVSPAPRVWALDRKLGLTKAGLARTRVSAKWLWLFRFQVGVVYTYAGFAKANADWLVHAQPLRIWLGSRTGMPVLGPLFRLEGAPLAMSWCGFLFDTFVVWFLLTRRTRPFAFVAVVVFHAMTRALFPIGMFPFIMIGAALVFFEPSWPRWILAKVRLVSPRAEAAEAAAPTIAPRRAWGWALAAIYCVLQLALPARFLAYGGDVRWHEQGMRWSWRVMVREKNGSITYVLRDKATGRIWHLSPRKYLTPLQERELQGQPDLILQLAHHIRDDYARRGTHLEVRVEAIVSLNGRRSAPLIDPDVDLASIPDGIARASWILPCPDDPPPHIRPI